ncbi:MAG: hypothetical protein U9N14_07510 [Pseudomonadota bacterium]|nr:hypothetical protein [Pseudomonadota bacterium]
MIDSELLTSLHEDDPDGLVELLETGLNKNDLESIFETAVNRRAYRCLNAMFSHGLDTIFHYGYLFRVAANRGDVKLLDFALRYPCDVTHPCISDTLCDAVMNNHIDYIRHLRDAGADLHVNANRPVVCALCAENWEAARELMLGDPAPDPDYKRWCWMMKPSSMSEGLPEDLLEEWQSGRLQKTAKDMAREKQQEADLQARIRTELEKKPSIFAFKRKNVLELGITEIVAILQKDPWGQRLYDIPLPKIILFQTKAKGCGGMVSDDGKTVRLPDNLPVRQRFDALADALAEHYNGMIAEDHNTDIARKRLNHVQTLRLHVGRSMTEKQWLEIDSPRRFPFFAPKL